MRIRILAGLALLAVSSSIPAKLASITATGVRAHMDFLASDALNGRGSGSRDEWIAATYIASQLERFGLEPMGDAGSYLQTVELRRIEAVAPPTLSVGSLHLKHGNQMVVAALSAATVSGPLQAFHKQAALRKGAVLLVPDGIEAGVPPEAQGAAVILWREDPKLRPYWDTFAANSITVGPMRITGLPAPQSSEPSPTQIILNSDAYAALSALAEGTVVSIEAETKETIGHTWNAIGKLTGSARAQRDQLILLSAHLDHLAARNSGDDRIYNGADDDASGTIAVLTLAEALAKDPRPKRTLVFALFGSEEAGSYGAKYFIDRPTVPIEKLVANLEFEMIGRPDPKVAPHTLWLTGWPRSNLGPALAAHGARLVGDPRPEENFFTRSDNFTLAQRGVVAQTVSSYGMHSDYHQPSDDIAHIDFAHMTEAIQSMLEPIRWLADSTFTPEWNPGGRP